MPVRKADLGPLDKIAEGGFGCVYRAPAFRAAGLPGPVAYKEFTSLREEQARAAAAAVDLWDRAAPADRAALERHAAWPVALVVDGSRGKVVGVVLPLLPDDFFCSQQNDDGSVSRKVREMSWLVTTKKQRAAARVDVPEVDRLDRQVLLAKLAYVIALLHRLGYVYGDLSFKNVAFALSPPRIKLLDCDAVAPLSDGQRRQGHTPFWAPPECAAQTVLQDTRTDAYKLGLAMLRCLSPGQGAVTSRFIGRLANESDEDRRLVERLLDDDPAARPPAKEAYLHLQRVLDQRIQPPRFVHAELLTAFRLRGQDAVLTHHIEGADTILVEGPNGQQFARAPTAGPEQFAFRPDASGTIAIVAENRFGKVRVELGRVDLFELPPFDVGSVQLPRPHVPALPAVRVPAIPQNAGPMVAIGVTTVGASRIVNLLAANGAGPPAVLASSDLSVPQTGAGLIRGAALTSGAALATQIHDAVAAASSHRSPSAAP